MGAVGLHANDYIDISLPEADATTLMMQMLPVWEIYNPRDIGALLRRYDTTFRELFSADTRERSVRVRIRTNTRDDQN